MAHISIVPPELIHALTYVGSKSLVAALVCEEMNHEGSEIEKKSRN